MEIKDLHAKQGNVEIVAEVMDKSTPREFEKFGNKGRVCNAKIKDSSGTITLTLWNEDCDKVGVGDRIKITNGYVGEYQGELQLSAGKFGKIEVLDKAVSKPEHKKEEPQVFKNFEEPKDELEDEDLDGDGLDEEFID